MNFRSAGKGFLLLVFVVSLSLTVSACGSKRFYTGKKLPADQVALLDIGRLKVLMVDDLPTPNLKARRLELLPGEHFLRATVDVDLYKGPIITYTFVAEAGEEYLFDADVNMSRGVNWTPWIKDKASGKIVGRWEK